jgi:hypothetical protein
MTTRTFNERTNDIELVADAITNAVKVALPAMVRREVELQLARTTDTDEPRQAVSGKAVLTRTSADTPAHPWPGTLPRPGKS